MKDDYIPVDIGYYFIVNGKFIKKTLYPEEKPMIPTRDFLLNEKAISEFVSGRFFRCIKPFLSWLKKRESYWFEYHNDGNFEIRSDNELGKKFEMTAYQLLTCFVPIECETNMNYTMRYFHKLGQLGVHESIIHDIIKFYEKYNEPN